MEFFTYRDGLLHAENVSLETIASSVGTPTYVYSRAAFEHSWREFESGLSDHDATIRYSVKSNSNLAVLALMARLGSGFDIVSGGEFERVVRAGGKPDKTIFSGVAKTKYEIALALKSGVFSLNLESAAELERIHAVAKELDTPAPISVRVNPDVDAKTHPHISTGLREAKFGVPFDVALDIYRFASQQPHLAVKGIAVHIGSQMTSLDPIISALSQVIDFVEQLGKDGINIQHLDVGGGLGVRYRDEEPPTIREYCNSILGLLRERGCNLSISIEPGRAISAHSGVLLSRVEYLKATDAKRFAVVDAAMNDLLRPVLYDAWMDIVPVKQKTTIEKMVCDVVGPVCETGDFLGKDRLLAVESGDLIAVLGAGAYGAVMSSNYNTRPKPVEVLVDCNQFDMIKARETFDQIVELELIPDNIRR